MGGFNDVPCTPPSPPGALLSDGEIIGIAIGGAVALLCAICACLYTGRLIAREKSGDPIFLSIREADANGTQMQSPRSAQSPRSESAQNKKRTLFKKRSSTAPASV